MTGQQDDVVVLWWAGWHTPNPIVSVCSAFGQLPYMVISRDTLRLGLQLGHVTLPYMVIAQMQRWWLKWRHKLTVYQRLAVEYDHRWYWAPLPSSLQLFEGLLRLGPVFLINKERWTLKNSADERVYLVNHWTDLDGCIGEYYLFHEGFLLVLFDLVIPSVCKVISQIQQSSSQRLCDW